MAQASRHAADAEAEALPAAGSGRPQLEQVRWLDGDRRPVVGLDAFPLSHAILRALWAEERDISNPEVRRAIADENGCDGTRLLAAETSEPVQKLYRQFTVEAERLGVFGAPTFVVAGDIFWGQDRLDFVDRKLDALRSQHGEIG